MAPFSVTLNDLDIQTTAGALVDTISKTVPFTAIVRNNL